MGLGSISLIIIIITIVYFIIIYNKFISLRAGINASESDIDVQLKRRYNLIPALIDTVKGYQKHETETLEKVVKARQHSMQANSMEEKSKAANMLSNALGKMFALAESYPDLKANTNFLKLQQELSSIENSIQNARRYYNAIARDYNAKLDSFPDLLVARNFNFTSRNYFELDENEAETVRSMPKVNFN